MSLISPMRMLEDIENCPLFPKKPNMLNGYTFNSFMDLKIAHPDKGYCQSKVLLPTYLC